jgi:hypothetical protein
VRPKKELPIPNHHRGEIEGILDGKPYNLCLTLGALAELESAFGDENMLALAQRFGGGKLSARDCVRIIGAGLRGANHDIADAAVARMQAEGGVTGFVDIVARLLTITFGSADDTPSVGTKNTPFKPDEAPLLPPPCGEGRGGGLSGSSNMTKQNEVPAPIPFPGTR